MQDNQNQTHWAYVAGIMDADGCFMIFKHKRKTHNGTSARSIAFPKHAEHWAITYIPGVKIGMIEREAIDFIMKTMGFGSMTIDGARKNRPKSKPIFNWYIRNKTDTLRFLDGIIPYLTVKKDRAIHLREFCLHLIKSGNPCYKGLSQSELNYREDMYIKMRAFNGNKVGATTKPLGHESANDSLIL